MCTPFALRLAISLAAELLPDAGDPTIRSIWFITWYPIVKNQGFASIGMCRPTVCVTGAGVGVDSAWEQKKLEARKMLENAAESPASSARFVGRFVVQDSTCFEVADESKRLTFARLHCIEQVVTCN